MTKITAEAYTPAAFILFRSEQGRSTFRAEVAAQITLARSSQHRSRFAKFDANDGSERFCICVCVCVCVRVIPVQ